MRLLAVHIDQFGQFQNQKFEFPDESFLIIQGQNEAGKSTLVRFIKYMIFGFPSRATLRSFGLVSENDAMVGGRLELLFPKTGKVSIVRHLRKSNGEAVIYFEDGRIENEEWLKNWLHGIDRPLYESVFSLDLEGLKDLHRLKDETLQHYLFSTGMMGNSKVLELERKLERDSNDLFKPNGKNPPINQTLDSLEQTRKKLQIWESKLTDYGDLKEHQERLRRQIDQIKKNIRELLEERQAFTSFKSIELYLVRYQSIKSELEAFPESLGSFPNEGGKRYETWNAQVVALESEKAGVGHQIEQLEEELVKLEEQLDRSWLENQEEIKKLFQDEQQITSLRLEYAKLNERVKQDHAVLETLCNELNLPRNPIDYRVINLIDSGLQTKQSLKSSLQELEEIQQESSFLKRDLSNLYQELEELTNSESSYDSFSDAEREQAESLYQIYLRQELNERERAWLEQELQTNMKREKSIHRMRQLSRQLPYIGIVVAILVGIGMSLSGNRSLSLLLGGSILAVTFMCWFGIRWLINANNTLFSQIRKWKERIQVLKEEEDLLNRNRPLVERLIELKTNEDHFLQKEVKKETFQKKIMTTENELKELETFKMGREQALKKWFLEKGYPMLQDLSIALDMVQLVEQAKEKATAIQSQREEMEWLEAKLQAFSDRLDFFRKKLKVPNAYSHDLLKKLEFMENLEREIIKNRNSQNILRKQTESFDERIARFKKECYNLWHQAEVNSEEEFYIKESMYIKKQSLLKEFDEVYRELQKAVPNINQLNEHLTLLHERRWTNVTLEDLNQQLNQLEEKKQMLQEQLEDLTVRIRQIEEDEQQPVLIHRFERLKDRLRNQANEWAVYRIALGLLTQAKETYKANRLPKLLSLAETYFNRLTNGAYVGMFYKEDEGFSVEHSNGAIFKAEELSRGTAEQLYVALRLGLVQSFDYLVPLPLLVDDGFVNFDEGRLGQILELLQEQSAERQVVLLTCHTYSKEAIKMEDLKTWGRKVVY